MLKVITVKNLVTSYGNKIIHDNISFDVKKGEIFLIIGGSGSGKTTLLHTLISLHPPLKGNVMLLNEDISKLNNIKRQEIAQRIGVVFQFGALFTSMNVLENITVFLDEYSTYPKHLYNEIAKIWIHAVGLDIDVCYKFPSELSGGMKKRVALARALIYEPEILFLDEPTSGLDPASACNFDFLISDLRAKFGITIVMITHDLDSIKDVADRFILLGDKKIEFNGNLKEFSKEFKNGLHTNSIFNSTKGRNYLI